MAVSRGTGREKQEARGLATIGPSSSNPDSAGAFDARRFSRLDRPAAFARFDAASDELTMCDRWEKLVLKWVLRLLRNFRIGASEELFLVLTEIIIDIVLNRWLPASGVIAFELLRNTFSFGIRWILLYFCLLLVYQRKDFQERS